MDTLVVVIFTLSKCSIGSSSSSSDSWVSADADLEECSCSSVFPDSAAKEEQAEYGIEVFARIFNAWYLSRSSSAMLTFPGNSATVIVYCDSSNKTFT